MSDERRTLLKSNLGFLIFFAPYTAVAIFLLLLGLGSALANVALVRKIFETWEQSESLLALLSRAMIQAAQLAEGALPVALDYFLSMLNLGFGLFIVWRRPWDWVARLLALGMVGTAMAFNFQAHGVLAVAIQVSPNLRWLNVFHFIFHAISGAMYVHALLLFPNGKLVPRRLIWLLVLIYFLMVEEIALPLLKAGVGASLFLPVNAIAAARNPIERFFLTLFSVRGAGLVMTLSSFQFGIGSPVSDFNSIIHAETVFFILLFGALIPVVGVTSQVYRYRAVSTQQERQQTKLVVWALTIAFSAGLAFPLALILSHVASGADLGSLVEELEALSSRIFPLLFAVIPIALFIAILRYRLFDMDVVINRTLVYGPLTAILGGLYASSIKIFQTLFVEITGEKSDAAIVITTLLVASAFTPLRARLQNIVDQRFKEVRDPEKDLRAFGNQVQLLVEWMGVEPLARRFLDEAARAFDVESGAVFLGKDGQERLLHSYGTWSDAARLSIPLENDGAQLGRVSLGARRNGFDYTPQDRETLQQAATLVARAMSLTRRVE